MTGLELSRRFYLDYVAPLLEQQFPGLLYAAALIGPGSEVLGFDDAISRDHDWGPRVLIFLANDCSDLNGSVHKALTHSRPEKFCGFSTNFGTQVRCHPVYHLNTYLNDYLGTWADTPDPVNWLAWPQQKLLSLTSGEVFHDEPMQLTRARKLLARYPRDVWLYLLASTWKRLGQEEHLVARAGSTDDELGARLITARLVRDLMRLVFLMEQRYWPYPKWFGRAFSQLRNGPELLPLLQQALAAIDWREREITLGLAYEHVARLHNQLGLTTQLRTQTQRFFTRPFHVMHADRWATALYQSIDDERVRCFPPIGSIDLWSDSTDLLQHQQIAQLSASFYRH